MAVTGYEGWEVPTQKYHVLTVSGVTNSGILDTFIAEDRYAILATGSGIDVLDMYCGAIISSGTIPGEIVSSVVAEYTTSSGMMYIGTSGNGVYQMRYHNITAPDYDFSAELKPVFSTTSTPAISDDEIRDICIAQGHPFRLLISTGLGVDYILEEGGVYTGSTRALISGSNACRITQAGEGYWDSKKVGVETLYDLNSSLIGGIITVDFTYSPFSAPSIPSNLVNDISIAEGSPNALAFATAGGDVEVSERQGNEFISPVKSAFTDKEVVSVSWGPDATFSTGKLYVLTTGIARVFDMTESTEIGSHHSRIDPLDKFITENTRDQALLSGTQTIVRTTAVL